MEGSGLGEEAKAVPLVLGGWRTYLQLQLFGCSKVGAHLLCVAGGTVLMNLAYPEKWKNPSELEGETSG
jgi:hypothetical protein